MRRFSKKIMILIVVVVLFVGGMFAYKYMGKADERAAKGKGKQFITYLTKSDFDKAYALTSSSLQKRQSKSQFAVSLGNLKAAKPIFLGSQTFIKDKEAYYYQNVDGLPKTASGRTDGNFSIVMAKEGTSWKVSTVSVK